MNYIPKIIYNGITITLTVPPMDDPFNEVLTPTNQESLSTDGTIQASQDFIEESRTIHLTFLTKAQTDALRTFFINWGSQRKTFQYYPSTDDSTNYTVTCSNSTFAPKRFISDGSGDFIYELDLNIRRTL